MTFEEELNAFLTANTNAYQIDDYDNKIEIWFQIKHKAFGEEADFVIRCNKTMGSLKRSINILKNSIDINVFVIEEIRKPSYNDRVENTIQHYKELITFLSYMSSQI